MSPENLCFASIVLPQSQHISFFLFMSPTSHPWLVQSFPYLCFVSRFWNLHARYMLSDSKFVGLSSQPVFSWFTYVRCPILLGFQVLDESSVNGRLLWDDPDHSLRSTCPLTEGETTMKTYMMAGWLVAKLYFKSPLILCITAKSETMGPLQ